MAFPIRNVDIPSVASRAVPRSSNWPAGVTLRARRPDDFDQLYGLFVQRDFQHNVSTLDPFECPEDARILLDRTGPGAFEMIADLETRVVGFAGLYVFGGRQRHVGCCTLTVHEQHQGKGVGTSLLRALLRTAYDYVGLERVQLTVFVDNRRAISLYTRAGFFVEGRLRSFVRREDGMVDALIMAHSPLPSIAEA